MCYITYQCVNSNNCAWRTLQHVWCVVLNNVVIHNVSSAILSFNSVMLIKMAPHVFVQIRIHFKCSSLVKVPFDIYTHTYSSCTKQVIFNLWVALA